MHGQPTVRKSPGKVKILVPRLELENSASVKRSYPKPRVYSLLNGQKVKKSFGKIRILLPRLESENSASVKRSYPKPKAYPPMDGQNAKNSARQGFRCPGWS